MDLSRLWNMLVGKPVDDKASLVLEQDKLAKLRAATKVMTEAAEVRRQLLAARKECKELEAGLGKSSRRLVLYVVGFAMLLVLILVTRSCTGC